MTVKIKICGLSTAETLDASIQAGADLVGFVFFERSPRAVALDQAAALARRVPDQIEKVGLFVNPDDDFLARALTSVPLDIVQLHGNEDPARAANIRERFGKQVMKAVGISTRGDLSGLAAYHGAADRLLLDGKPPKGADRPGGNATAFDWTILKDWSAPLPWILAGGLHPGNVAEALSISGASGVDVSSGVESAPGQKDQSLINAFITAARGARIGGNDTIMDDGLPKLVL